METIIAEINSVHSDITEQSIISSAKFVTETAIPTLANAGINLQPGSLISIHSISRILGGDNAGRKFTDILLWSKLFGQYDSDRIVCLAPVVEEEAEAPVEETPAEVNTENSVVEENPEVPVQEEAEAPVEAEDSNSKKK